MKVYKVGDHVVINKSNIDNMVSINYSGQTGVIVGVIKCDIPTDNYPYNIKIDGYNHSIWCTVKGYAPFKQKIVITTDGKITTAKLFENRQLIKAVEAKCHPEDTFDFNVGAKLAVERLTKVEEAPKYYNGKVVCITNYYEDRTPISGFTIGKVYTVTNGVIVSDNGFVSMQYRDIESLCGGMGNTFIPLVEN